MGSYRASWRSLSALAAASVLALCLGGAAGSEAATAFQGAELSIDSIAGGDQALLAIEIQLQDGLSDGELPGLAARVDVTIPAGYQFDLGGVPGTPVAQLIGVLTGADGSNFNFANGAIAVDDPATWAADPVAQACAPGAHAAVWRASLNVLGPTIGIPIAVDAVQGSASGPTYVMRICPTQPVSASLPRGATLESMTLVLGAVATAPTSPGAYRWSALVTPASQGSFTPQPSAAFELRAVERRPNVLTMRARFEPKTNTIEISGKLEAAGAAWAGAGVSFVASGSGSGPPTPLGEVPTAADGSFFLRVPAIESETISASVSLDAHACSAPPSTAPAGCLSETDASPPGAEATVVVPRKTDPRLVVRAADQARATRSVLRSTDLPGGFDAGEAPLPCAGFTPDLHRLTATGQARSEVLVSGNQRMAAFATASVLRTAGEARTDFTGVAQLAALRCEVKDVTADSPNEQVLGVGPLRAPRVGDGSRAFRAQISDPVDGRITIDLLFVRVGRVVIALHTYSAGSPNLSVDLALARVLATRAAQ